MMPARSLCISLLLILGLGACPAWGSSGNSALTAQHEFASEVAAAQRYFDIYTQEDAESEELTHHRDHLDAGLFEIVMTAATKNNCVAEIVPMFVGELPASLTSYLACLDSVGESTLLHNIFRGDFSEAYDVATSAKGEASPGWSVSNFRAAVEEAKANRNFGIQVVFCGPYKAIEEYMCAMPVIFVGDAD